MDKAELEELMGKAEEMAKQWDNFEDDVKDIIRKKGYDLKAVAPAMPCIYAQMCESLDMPFEDAIAFAMKAICKIYDVEMVKVKDTNEAEIHSGTNTPH